MNLVVGGVSHRTASLAVRERLTIPLRDLPDALRQAASCPELREVAILSTCNRVEYYAAGPDPAAAARTIRDLLCHRSRLSPDELAPASSFSVGDAAVRHALRVTAGLESAVLGESEITAQVKAAYLAAQAQGTAGPLLHRLFQKALHGTKVIRARTRVAEGQASIGSVVVTLARRLFGDRLTDCEVLLWGAGKAAEASAKHLLKHRVRQLWVVNRTQVRAQELASLCQGQWLAWEQALQRLAHVDVAIICTQAPHYVIDIDDLAAFPRRRSARPLCLIDLAVPRNVDPRIAGRSGVRLYNIDDLQAVAQEVRASREQELPGCERIIDEQAERFQRWWGNVTHEEADACEAIAA